jgi:hypothetical protein
MSEQVERLITGVMTIALGIVGVAFIFALVTKGSNTANVAGALSGGFACALKAAMGGGNTCGPSTVASVIRGGPSSTGTANSSVNFGCTTVDGVQYCP